MKFTKITISILTIKIIDTIRKVRSLLHLHNQTPLTDRMHHTSRYKIYITLLYRIFLQHLFEIACSYSLNIFSLRNITIETQSDICIFFCIKHIPHLCFTSQSMFLVSQFIIRVNLYRKVTVRVYYLQQQRKFCPILFINPITYQISHIHFCKVSKSITLQPTIYHLTVSFFHSRNIPTLPYCFQFWLIMAIYILYFISTPKFLLEYWLKL